MFGKLKGYRTDGNKVYFEYEGCKTSPVLEAITDNIVNVLVDYTGGGHRTRAVEGELGERLNAGKNASEEGLLTQVAQEESGVILKTASLTVVVGDDFTVDFYDKENQPLSLAYRGTRNLGAGLDEASKELLSKEGHGISDRAADYPVQELRALDAKDCIYGLGDRPVS